MSGDVQPRKRKDKKRKKDELGIEEPRGTAAVLGEGDVFMHSQHDHGTGGHWCAKIIFFSLLAVLVTLIGLIILENRGLSELEANQVESRYSGVLEGWLEDAPDDDHHDEHTLELKHHHDEDEDDHSQELNHDEDDDDEHGHDDEDDEHDHDDDDDHDEEDDESGHDIDDLDDQNDGDDDDEEHEQGDDASQENEDDDENQQDEDESEDQNLERDEDNDSEEPAYRKYVDSAENQKDDDENDDFQNDSVDENDSAGDDDDVNDQSVENDDGDEGNEGDDSSENNQQDEQEQDNETHEDEEEDDHEEEAEEDSGLEVERLEKEISDEDVFADQEPAPEIEDDDKSEEISNEVPTDDDGDDDDGDDGVAEDDEFLEPDDIEEELPVVEHIVAPKGKPLVEVEEETSTMKPADTLAEEEEYEKQQEELRREQAQASHMWLKLAVGGALLVATHAVVRRCLASRDDTPASDEHASREETPVIDRRMTLVAEERAAPAAVTKQVIEETVQPVVEEVITQKVSSVIKSAPPPPKEESEEEEEEEVVVETKDVTAEEPVETEDKELYSDQEEEGEDEEVEEEEEIVEKVKEAPKQGAPPQKTEDAEQEAEDIEQDEDVPDDVEIIDEEQLEEELEDEEDDEDISDVDDAELLSRLEAKYGRLPEPDRPSPKPKDGGNSIEDDWPGEPSDQYWRQQLDQAEEELRQGSWSVAYDRASDAALKDSARARWVAARALDAGAAARRDNRLLTRAITAYLEVLKMNERLSDAKLLEVANQTLDRIRFRGNYLSAEPVYRLLIRRFPDVPDYYNNMTVSFLMANRADLAEQVIKETLKKWPDDRIALAHLGFVLKTLHNRLEEAVEAFQKALEGDTGSATEPRFYYHLGDALLLLGRYAEAHEVHKRGAAHGHFLSPAQRSLYNVERLKSQPWWDIEKTPYLRLARALEKSWKEILKEGEAAKALYEKEKEGLKEKGEWSQLDLFVRGQEIPNRCNRAPVTCSIVRSEVAASGCRRGQIKFSAMEAGTHVRPHVGPTNCRLRMHLGLSNTKDTFIRVDQETRQWEVGKTLMFDDSFEHEVWHNGTGTRLVLIVDVWHPALTPHERRTLPPI